MAARRTIQIKDGMLPYRIVIPERLANQDERVQRPMWKEWMDWLAGDEAQGLWQSGWDEKDEFFAIAFSDLNTATAFKMKFC